MSLIDFNWNELNKSIQTFIIYKMLNSFNETVDDNFLNINERFSKNKCVVNLYCVNGIVQGVCISWNADKFIYLDKFFSINFKKGVGSGMLNLFIEKYRNHNIIWRTNEDIAKFYLRNKSVHTFFNYKINREKEYVFMYVKNKKFFWEYEDICNFKIKSCFQ